MLLAYLSVKTFTSHGDYISLPTSNPLNPHLSLLSLLSTIRSSLNPPPFTPSTSHHASYHPVLPGWHGRLHHLPQHHVLSPLPTRREVPLRWCASATTSWTVELRFLFHEQQPVLGYYSGDGIRKGMRMIFRECVRINRARIRLNIWWWVDKRM